MFHVSNQPSLCYREFPKKILFTKFYILLSVLLYVVIKSASDNNVHQQDGCPSRAWWSLPCMPDPSLDLCKKKILLVPRFVLIINVGF